MIFPGTVPGYVKFGLGSLPRTVQNRVDDAEDDDDDDGGDGHAMVMMMHTWPKKKHPRTPFFKYSQEPLLTI